jgi:hypothetical protein
MIRKVSFRNFKALRHVDVELERLTVIVGGNASGKTSILEGMYYLSQLSRTTFVQVFSGVQGPLHLFTRGGSGEMELRCADDQMELQLRARLTEPMPDDVLHTPWERDWFTPWKDTLSTRPVVEGDGAWEDAKPSSQLADRFGRVAFLRFETSRLAAPSYSPTPRAGIESTGQGLAPALAYLALNQPEAFEQLQELLRAVVPAVRRVRFDRVPIPYTEYEPVTIGGDTFARRTNRDVVADALVFDFEGAPNVPADLTSEGTILVLGLLTVLLSPARPRVVLFDDLDRGLHPLAQSALVTVLRTLLDRNPELQIVATTHSPYLLDDLKPEEVRLTALQPDGTAQCGRLDEHPQFEKWKKEMAPGEFWSHVGEKWIAERQLAGSR